MPHAKKSTPQRSRRPKDERKQDAAFAVFGNAVSAVMKEHAAGEVLRSHRQQQRENRYRNNINFVNYLNNSAHAELDFQGQPTNVVAGKLQGLALCGEETTREMSGIAQEYNALLDEQYEAEERLPGRVTPLVLEMAKARAGQNVTRANGR